MFNKKLTEQQEKSLKELDVKLKECSGNFKQFNKDGDYDKIDIEIKKFETLVKERELIKPLSITEKAQVSMVLNLMKVFSNRNIKK